MKLVSSSPIFSGLPVRDLLQQICYKASSVDEKVTLSLIFRTDEEVLLARRDSHLTNATEKEFQIRFPLRDRVKRAVMKLASDVARFASDREMSLEAHAALLKDDFVSVEFFSNLPEVNIEWIDDDRTEDQLRDQVTTEQRMLISNEETHLLTYLGQPTEHLNEILQWCRERIYATDYRSAYRVLSRIPAEDRTDSVNHMLGLCTNFFGRTEESEHHFRAVLRSANPLARVQAAYVTSMLYLRMHPRELQSVHEAEVLLETAYQTLLGHPEIDDCAFHRVFNRNGYALCLFRRGRVNEALEMLELGILELKKDGSGARRLHQSVLIYNAVQCLRSLERFAECELKCEELLKIDPLFPEYHMEQARVFLDQSKTSDALRSLKRAEELDSFIPEAHALKGFAEIQNGDLESASVAYAHASNLDPSNIRHRLDLGYCLSELGRIADLAELLKTINIEKCTSDEVDAIEALQLDLKPNLETKAV